MADGPGSSNSNSNRENCDDSSSHMMILSEDHLISILLLLPLESILSFAMSCKKTITLTRSNTLWKSICTRDWGHSITNYNSNSSVEEDWYQVYRRLRNLHRLSCFNLTLTQQGPTSRASHSLNFFSGSLLLFGGGCEGGRHLDDTWIAYIGNDYKRMVNWQRVISPGPAPTGRFGHSCVVLDNSLVLFGGINDSGIRQNDTWIAQQTTTTTTCTLSWRLLDVGPVSPPARGAHACCSLDNRRMLIHGGIGLSGTRLGDTWVLYLSENLCFGTWHETVSDPAPSPRSGHTMTCTGGCRTVLFGGRGMGYEVLSDVWYFDSSGGWVAVLFELKDIAGGVSLPRVGHSASLIAGGRVLIYGGEDSFRRRKDDFWLLDISQEQRRRMWKRLKCEGYLPKRRSFHRACADGSGRFLYVFGGMVDGILQPAEPAGLRFDGELFVAELLL